MCQNTEIEMNQTHRVNIFFFFFLKKVPGTLHDGDSVDTGMSTNYQKSLAACKESYGEWEQNDRWCFPGFKI